MRRRTATLTAALAAAVTLPLLTTGPAAAGGLCSDRQHRSFSTPGYNTDLYVKVCSTGGSSRHHGGYILVSWLDGGDSAADGNRKFDSLRIHGRVERYDADYVNDSWSIAGLVNRSESGTWTSPTMTAASTLRGGWTADGKVTFDLDRDGEGVQDPWQLHGSTMVY